MQTLLLSALFTTFLVVSSIIRSFHIETFRGHLFNLLPYIFSFVYILFLIFSQQLTGKWPRNASSQISYVRVLFLPLLRGKRSLPTKAGRLFCKRGCCILGVVERKEVVLSMGHSLFFFSSLVSRSQRDVRPQGRVSDRNEGQILTCAKKTRS